MVEEQLRQRGIWQARVLEAMSEVPREHFVAAGFCESAYEDSPLPIGYGQTISQPLTVAFMCQSLDLHGDEKVLEIGTGSGYGAAVLSRLARVVYSIERIPKLAYQAEARLRRLGYENVHVRIANGSLGLPVEAPFDAILVTAGGRGLPRVYLDQLADGGRIVIPLGSAVPHSQTLYRFTVSAGTIVVDALGGFSFVPLIGEYGWGDDENESCVGDEPHSIRTRRE
jgi:protein-L-isoaspartate(D-aspartate) O-methyltransferase